MQLFFFTTTTGLTISIIAGNIINAAKAVVNIESDTIQPRLNIILKEERERTAKPAATEKALDKTGL